MALERLLVFSELLHVLKYHKILKIAGNLLLTISLEFFGCLGRLYACEEAGKVKCPNTERCIPLQPVVSEVEEETTGKTFLESNVATQ